MKRECGLDEEDDIESILGEFRDNGMFDQAGLDRILARREACGDCGQNAGLHVLTVECEKCGCSGLSLLRGRCKMRKWPSDDHQSIV
jgi:hypothetical protein